MVKLVEGIFTPGFLFIGLPVTVVFVAVYLWVADKLFDPKGKGYGCNGIIFGVIVGMALYLLLVFPFLLKAIDRLGWD